MARINKGSTVGGEYLLREINADSGYNSLYCPDDSVFQTYDNANIIYHPNDGVSNVYGVESGLRVTHIHRNLIFCIDNDGTTNANYGTWVYDMDSNSYAGPQLVTFIPDYHIKATTSKYAIATSPRVAYNYIKVYSLATFELVKTFVDSDFTEPTGYIDTYPVSGVVRRAYVHADDRYIVANLYGLHQSPASQYNYQYGAVAVIDARTLSVEHVLPNPEINKDGSEYFGETLAYSNGMIYGASVSDVAYKIWASTPYLRAGVGYGSWIALDDMYHDTGTVLVDPLGVTYEDIQARDGYLYSLANGNRSLTIANINGHILKSLDLSSTGLNTSGYWPYFCITNNFVFLVYYYSSATALADYNKISVFNKHTGEFIENLQNPFLKSNPTINNYSTYIMLTEIKAGAGDTIVVTSSAHRGPEWQSGYCQGAAAVIHYKTSSLENFLTNITAMDEQYD